LPKTTIPADKKAEEWFHNFVPIIPKFVSEYGIKPNPTSVRSGIDSVLPGLKELEVSPVILTQRAELINRMERLAEPSWSSTLRRSIYLGNCSDLK
jgi:hypothetical protein